MATKPEEVPPPEVVWANLCEVSRLREERRSRRQAVDLGPESVARRLSRVSQLRDLGLSLAALGKRTLPR